MALIEDIKKNLEKMSDDELREHIRKLRASRRQLKKKPQSVSKIEGQIASLLGKLSPEDIAKVLGGNS